MFPKASRNGIPVVDLHGLSNDPKILAGITQEIDMGLKSHSCIYLVGHCLSQEAVAVFFQKSKDFFELPDEMKLMYEKGKRKGLDIEGYSRSVKESFRERIDLKLGSTFPERISAVPELAGSAAEVDRMMCTLGRFLLARIANALEMDEMDLIQKHGGAVLGTGNSALSSKSHFSSIYYQAIPESVKPDHVQLIMEKHTDLSSLTLLTANAQGLQIQLRDGTGEWLDVEPIEGAILVNVGDLMEYLTQGKYLATVHRVKHFPLDSYGRQSLAYFIHPDKDVWVTPLRDTGKWKDSQIKAGNYFEQMMLFKNLEVAGEATLEQMTLFKNLEVAGEATLEQMTLFKNLEVAGEATPPTYCWWPCNFMSGS